MINGARQGQPVANRVFETIWDGGGTDLIDASAYRDGVSIDLTPGAGSILSHDQLAWLNQKDPGDPPIYASANVYLAHLHEGDGRAFIENAKGGGGDDMLIGNAAANRLLGGGGDDQLSGRSGGDRLIGGDGDDRLSGATGRDALLGQAGDDLLAGGAGRDRLLGGAGADTLTGDAGRDVIHGGGGDDLIEGGAGRDALVGGGGRDTFRFMSEAGVDSIRDFDPSLDLIDLTALDTGWSSLRLTDAGAHTRVAAEAVVFILNRIDADELTADQFIF